MELTSTSEVIGVFGDISTYQSRLEIQAKGKLKSFEALELNLDSFNKESMVLDTKYTAHINKVIKMFDFQWP